MMNKLRMTGKQHAALAKHLLPEDGCEAAAVVLCGRQTGAGGVTLLVHNLVMIPYERCSVRSPDSLVWPVEDILPLVELAAKKDLAVVKFHSHPGGYPEFSSQDDRSDREFFSSVYGWMDSENPHGSAVMLPDGRLFGRFVLPGGTFAPMDRIAVAGDDMIFWDYGQSMPFAQGKELLRQIQLFGEGTVHRLRKLCVAVIGCSGTGSIVIEQLARLGVGKIVLIDHDIVEAKNLNRILNATADDVAHGRKKVEIAKRAITSFGLGTQVVTIAENLITPGTVREVAACDLAFGCMDGAEGRHVLNRLAAFYLLPYFDLGVRLDADGYGGIDQVCGSVHYLQPDGSGLLDRNIYTMEDVRAEGMLRTAPEMYERQVKEGYIKGVVVDRPAVISVNMLIASLAVNEFLARLHPYRLDSNGDFAAQTVSLSQGELYKDGDGVPSQMFARHVGRGDTKLLLDMPELTEPGGG